MNYSNILPEGARASSLFPSLKNIYTALMLVFLMACSLYSQENTIITGAERLLSTEIGILINRNIGLVTNHTAVFPNGVHLADSLFALRPYTHLTALFGPEHGIRGEAGAGETIQNSTDAKTGVPVFSLYGKYKKPNAEMLKGVDLIIFDIQDVGARFYTYISTLYYTIEAAGENGIEVLVLDRPNPISFLGSLGPVREPDLQSFVGIAPIPIAHGLSIGELAKYYCGEIFKEKSPKLTVIEMRNYSYSDGLEKTTKNFVKPSPNIMEPETILLYPGTCLFEGTNLSEGRGTFSPFLLFGSPYLDNIKLLAQLKQYNYTDISFEAVEYTPREIPNTVLKPKYKDEICYGIKLNPENNFASDPILLTIRILHHVIQNHPDAFKFREKSFEILSGQRTLREKLLSGEKPEIIYESWKPELEKFNTLKKGYLLYE